MNLNEFQITNLSMSRSTYKSIIRMKTWLELMLN